MYAAVTRLDPATGTSPAGDGGWYPEEKLSVDQALAGFTMNAGYGWFKEGKMGGVEKGMWADWVVVDRDVGADEEGKSLRDVVVRETWVGGRRVWPRDEDFVKESWVEKLRMAVLNFVHHAAGWARRDGREEL